MRSRGGVCFKKGEMGSVCVCFSERVSPTICALARFLILSETNFYRFYSLTKQKEISLKIRIILLSPYISHTAKLLSVVWPFIFVNL